MCPQLLMSQSDNRLSGKWFIQYITTHHLTQTYQNILQIIDKFLIFLHFQQNRLIQHKKSFQTVQFSTEYNPFVILVHQNISDKLGHMLRLFHVVGAGLIVHILGLWGLRGAHHSRDDRLGGRGGRGGRLRRLPPCGHFDFALLKIFPRRGVSIFPSGM